MLYPIKLVIFDFDGVIIDSEYLYHKLAAKLITDSGCPIRVVDLNEHYSGHIFKDILKDLENKRECYFSASLIDRLHQEFIAAIETELQLIEGIEATIEKLDRPYCICSNSRKEDIVMELKYLNLYNIFEDKIFSAYDVGRLKPEPDVFLHAAQHYNIDPEQCLVIEDSVPGILAAKKAGMRAVGFTGGSHTYQKHSNILSETGAETVYSCHNELPLIIQALQDWRDK